MSDNEMSIQIISTPRGHMIGLTALDGAPYWVCANDVVSVGLCAGQTVIYFIGSHCLVGSSIDETMAALARAEERRLERFPWQVDIPKEAPDAD
ncbi:MAG: hypothetical protein KDK91_34435 [Gammaproteobacteria bacterium]|nr:hypothetical protein [Gammaproteobacteria bacterium]